MKTTTLFKVTFSSLILFLSFADASPLFFKGAYLYCPNWRNIGAKAVIILNQRSYNVAVEDGDSPKTLSTQKLLSKFHSIACGIHTIGAISPKFDVTGTFQPYNGQNTFVVSEAFKTKK